MPGRSSDGQGTLSVLQQSSQRLLKGSLQISSPLQISLSKEFGICGGPGMNPMWIPGAHCNCVHNYIYMCIVYINHTRTLYHLSKLHSLNWYSDWACINGSIAQTRNWTPSLQHTHPGQSSSLPTTEVSNFILFQPMFRFVLFSQLDPWETKTSCPWVSHATVHNAYYSFWKTWAVTVQFSA